MIKVINKHILCVVTYYMYLVVYVCFRQSDDLTQTFRIFTLFLTHYIFFYYFLYLPIYPFFLNIILTYVLYIYEPYIIQ